MTILFFIITIDCFGERVLPSATQFNKASCFFASSFINSLNWMGDFFHHLL